MNVYISDYISPLLEISSTNSYSVIAQCTIFNMVMTTMKKIKLRDFAKLVLCVWWWGGGGYEILPIMFGGGEGGGRGTHQEPFSVSCPSLYRESRQQSVDPIQV